MPAHTTESTISREARRVPRGQILVIFAFLLTILMGMAAFVIDMAWIWTNELQVQRAADAAALAGVVHLPQEPADATTAAEAESRRNGYRNAVNGVIIDAAPDPNYGRRMIVTVSAPVDTFFMRVFGIDQVTVSRTAKAEYILPVPMGSPQNYYGVGRFVDATTTTSTQTINADTGFEFTNDAETGQWTTAQDADDEDDVYATEQTHNQAHQWDEFGLQGGIPNDPTLVIDRIEVRLQDVQLTGSGTQTNCRIGVEISWGAGVNGTWSTQLFQSITSTNADRTLGTSTAPLPGTTPWGLHNWTRTELSDTNFRVRLTWLETPTCASTRNVQLDGLEARVMSHYTQTTSTTVIDEIPVRDPYDTVDLVPQKFWGAMQSQGAPSIQGDAYMTKYQTRTSVLSSTYCPTQLACGNDPDGYYNYAVEFPSGGGEVWIFDPGFCDGQSNQGTGESWTVGGTNGASPSQPISAFYTLYNTAETPWDFVDDSVVAASNNAFKRGANNNGAKYYDDELYSGTSTPSGSGYTDCDGVTGHHDWWRIASGLPAGTYRLHTTSTDTSAPNDQNNSTGLNSFAIWAKASAGINGVHVYGLGAMEAYFPLPEGEISDFFLAQIDAVHAGKWMDISLWDPGDTSNLVADLSILMPTTTGYTAATFYYNTNLGTNVPANFTCGPTTSTPRTSLRTNNGSGGIYNGYWVRLCIQIPDNYTAPHPSSETRTSESGWWQIRYAMGSGSGASTDLTTWKVDIRGNPVHLVVP